VFDRSLGEAMRRAMGCLQRLLSSSGTTAAGLQYALLQDKDVGGDAPHLYLQFVMELSAAEQRGGGI
jgi:hypothetical protein